MASASDQLMRLLTLIPWLVAHPGVTKAEAAQTFAISVEQLERDLELAACAEVGRDTLSSLDIDFWDDEITVLDAQSVDRPMQLRVDEAVTLLVGLRSLAAVPGLADREVVDHALAKVEEAIGVSSATVSDAGSSPPAVPDAVIGAVQDALSRDRRVHLTYWTPARDEVSERDVDPMRLVTVATSGYLQGWCHSVEAVRTFRLDRIVAVDVLDVPVRTAARGRPGRRGPGRGTVGRPGPPTSWSPSTSPREIRWVVDYHPVEAAAENTDGGLRVTLRTPRARLGPAARPPAGRRRDRREPGRPRRRGAGDSRRGAPRVRLNGAATRGSQESRSGSAMPKP